VLLTGYWFLPRLSRAKLAEMAESVPSGPSTVMIAELACRHQMTIGAGREALVRLREADAILVEARMDGWFITRMSRPCPTAKFGHTASSTCFENEHIDSGNEFTVFDTPQGFRAGVLICYDLNIVENARITALMGQLGARNNLGDRPGQTLHLR
jgi:hypothetical protein